MIKEKRIAVAARFSREPSLILAYYSGLLFRLQFQPGFVFFQERAKPVAYIQ
jgi:hypothetical protein